MSRGPKSDVLEKLRALGEDAAAIEVRRGIKKGTERLSHLRKFRPNAPEIADVKREVERLGNALKRKASSQHEEASSSLRQRLVGVIESAHGALVDLASQEQAVDFLAATLAAFGRTPKGKNLKKPQLEVS